MKTITIAENEVKLMALPLAEDESTLTNCPFCRAEHERSFSVTRKNTGIVYHCFRASCGASGFISAMPSAVVRQTPAKKYKPYNGPMYDSIEFPFHFLVDRFNIHVYYLNDVQIADFDAHHYLLPVYSIHNDNRSAGWQLRKFDGSKPKAILYPEADGPYIQKVRPRHYADYRANPYIAIVEDYFSMLKVQAAFDALKINGVAISILGTHISDELAVWISRKARQVMLMLDADATNKSFAFKKEYNIIWPKCRVIRMDKDPKDTDISILQELITNGTKAT